MYFDRYLVARRTLTGALAGGALIGVVASANAAPVQVDTFSIDVNVTSSEYAVSNIVEFTSGPEGTSTGQFSIPQGGGHIVNTFPFDGTPSDYTVLLVGLAGSGGAELANHTGGLVLFTNTTFAPTAAGQQFDNVFAVGEAAHGYTEALLENDLVNETVEGDIRLNFFASDYIAAAGFTLGDPLKLVAFTAGEITGDAQSSAVFATPLPAALPLFAGGLGALGLLGWRRKRRA